MTPFDHLKNLHTKKKKWNDFNDEEKKNFNVFIINKALSFNPNYLNVVNLVQKYSVGQITQKEVFKIYFNLLPSKFRFYKWIKGKKEKENKDKIEYLAIHFECSKKEAKDAAERESLDAITEMLDLMEHKIRDDYVEASGVYWRRFLCNDAFRSSKQKKDHTVKAIPVNLHVQNLLVDSHRTQVSPLPKSTQSHNESEKKLVSQLSTWCSSVEFENMFL